MSANWNESSERSHVPSPHSVPTLRYLKPHHLRNKNHHLEALIFISVCLCLKGRLSLPDTLGFPEFPHGNLNTFQFSLPAAYCKNLNSADCARSAHIDYRDDAAFREQIFTLKSDFKLAFVFLFLLTNELPDEELNCISAHKPFKAYWKLEAPTGLTFKNCTFCTHCTCFVFITEQRGTFALHNKMNAFISEVKSVYCAVHIGP